MQFTLQLRYCPFVRLLIPFLTGIVFSCMPGINLWITLSLFFLVGILLPLFYRLAAQYSFRWYYGIMLNVFLFLSGLSLVKAHQSRMISETCLIGKEINAKAVVFEYPRKRDHSVRVVIKTVEIYDSMPLQRPVKILTSFAASGSTEKLKQGDLVFFRARLSGIKGPSNPQEFDYRKLMANRGIVLQAYIPEDRWFICGRMKNLRTFSARLRDDILTVYKRNGLKGDELAVLSALTLGLRNDMPGEITRSYAAAGAMHVLAISGLHVGIIYVLLNSLLKLLFRFRYGQFFRTAIIVLVLWTFACIAGLRPSVVRAAFMFSVIQAGTGINRQSDIYNTIAVSAFFLLLFNPMQVFETGFQLSYLAVTGIVFFQPRIYSLLVLKNWLADKIWLLLTVSISAQLGTAPLSIYCFHQFPMLFWVTNLFVIPLVTLIIYLAAGIIVLGAFHVTLAWLAKLTIVVIKFTGFCVGLVENISWGHADHINMNQYEVLMLYGVLFLFAIFIVVRHPRILMGSLTILWVFLLLNTISSISGYTTKKFVVFNTKGYSALCMISGKKALTLHTFPDIHDKRFVFAVNNCLIKNGIAGNTLFVNSVKDSVPEITEPFWLLSDRGICYFCMPGIKGVWIGGNAVLACRNTSKLRADCVILADNANVSIDALTSEFDFRMLILDSSNSRKYIKKFTSACSARGIKVHSVIDDNALEMNL